MTLVDLLGDVARTGSGHALHIRTRGAETEAITHTELHHDAGRFAHGLRAGGVRPGDRVAVVLPTSADFARAFFGVLAAGAVAVPLPGPAPFRSADGYLRRTVGALRASRVRHLVTDAQTAPLLSAPLSALPAPVAVLDAGEVAGTACVFVAREGADPAVVQYTSGTSDDPRGVVLSHANLAAGVRAIALGTGMTTGDVGCAWLPLHHDMGLVGAFLTPVLQDLDIHLQRPEDFLWDPLGWVRTVAETGATITVAPDSGYRYVLRRGGEDLPDGLDLSRWRIALNGAEPVDPAMQDAFVRRFAPAGLDPDLFLPVYGLAEATLAVTFPPVGRPTRTLRADRAALGRGRWEPAAPTRAHRTLVSVGRPVAGIELRLVDAAGDSAAPDTVAEIQVRGDSVTSGYDHAPEATARVLHEGGWVSTGDLGMLHDGELFVVGRSKEMVVVHGANHFAGDIEAVVSRVPGLPVHGILARQAHGVDGTALDLVVETTARDPEERAAMSGRIRAALSAELGVTPADITYVRRGGIARTSSGKALRRSGGAQAATGG